MTRTWRLSCPLLLCLGVAACSSPKGGTDVGNGATAELEIRAFEQAPAAQSRSITLASGTRVDELWMVFERIRLQPGASCDRADEEVDVAGPVVADSVGEGVLGGPLVFPVEPGPFCRFRAKLHELDEGEGPPGTLPELQGLSILVRGARADGTPFTVASDLGDTFELDAKDGSFELPAGNNPLLLAYDVALWIGALDLDGLVGGAPIVISDDQNQDRLGAFENAAKASARLLRDANANGAVDPDEAAPGQELAD